MYNTEVIFALDPLPLALVDAYHVPLTKTFPKRTPVLRSAFLSPHSAQDMCVGGAGGVKANSIFFKALLPGTDYTRRGLGGTVRP